MAKLSKGLVTISGKHRDDVFVNSGKYGNIIRKAPARGSKKDEPALVQQYSRTRFLNGLAGELNSLLASHFGAFKAAGFYHQVQKCFRQEPLDNRFLLLRQLKGLELNPAYPLHKLGACTLTTKAMKRRLQVQLQVDLHPPRGRYSADCYYYELILFSWDKSGQAAQADRQLGNWVSPDGGRPLFDFNFTLPAGTRHWLLCLRQQLGVNKKDLEYFEAQGVQIAEAGSFDKGDMAILEKRKLEAAATRTGKAPKKALPAMKRVEAKRFL